MTEFCYKGKVKLEYILMAPLIKQLITQHHEQSITDVLRMYEGLCNM